MSPSWMHINLWYILTSYSRAKKAEMKDEGRHSRDLADQYAFLLFRDSGIMAKVIKQGLIARQMPFNALGKFHSVLKWNCNKREI